MNGPIFPPEEYQERIRRAQAEMDRRGIDALIVCALDNIYYLSGYDGTISGYLYTFLLLETKGDPALFIHEVDHGTALYSSWVRDLHLWKHGQVPEAETISFLKARGLETAVLGMEEGAAVVSVATDRALRRGLPEARFVDVSDLLARQRWTLSPSEIALMRKSAAHGDSAAAAGLAALRAGVAEKDVAKAVTDALHEVRSGRWTSVFCLGSGDKSAALHSFASDRVLAVGDVVTLVPHADVGRYVTSIHRTATVGRAPSYVRDLYTVSLEALQASVKHIRPGVPGGEIDRISRRVSAKYDRYRCHRTGFSMGIAFGYGFKCMGKFGVMDGIEEPLLPGMVLSIEPNLQDIDHKIGILLGNNYLVTETGCESLHKLPLDLFESL